MAVSSLPRSQYKPIRGLLAQIEDESDERVSEVRRIDEHTRLPLHHRLRLLTATGDDKAREALVEDIAGSLPRQLRRSFLALVRG